MSECRLISRSLIPLSASSVAFKSLCSCIRDALLAKTDNLQVSYYTNHNVLLNNLHFSLMYA